MAVDILNIAAAIGTLFTLYVSFVFILSTFYGRSNLARLPSLPSRLPFVSIIVPAYNEARQVGSTIRSLLDIDWPKNRIEIIAVNDGSTDDTGGVMKSFRKDGVVYIKKNNEGKSSALNSAMKIARGDVVVCMDADSVASRDVLKKTVGFFNDPKVAAVTTTLKVGNPKTFWQKVQWVEYTLNILYRKVMALLGAQFVIPGPFSLYRRATLEKIGGFEEGNITEDMEIGLRMQSRGYKIENTLLASTYTTAPATLKALIRQRTRWYRGFIINNRRYGYMYLNPAFGNLGLFMLPMTCILVAFSLLFFGIFTYSSIDGLMKMANINLLTGLVLPSIGFGGSIYESVAYTSSLFNLLWLITVSMMISLMALSFKLGKEKMTIKIVPLVLFTMFAYSYVITLTWINALYKELRGAKLVWEK